MLTHITIQCDKCGGTGKCTVFNYRALRQRRLYVGVSLRQVANALSLSPPYLSDVERGRRGVTKLIERGYELKRLKNIAKGVGWL